ncbi:MAG: 3-hydroxyacyl-CoA dehydrogenase [Deltaproteobacteria bacterium]|nr:MAG: 3-hydroxyacyl-CoA dehydrogenase [Deltaproteobacteria bacterium]
MAIRYEKEDGIVTLVLDHPTKSVNILDSAFGAAFQESLEKLQAEEDLKGVIVTSAKSTFLAGADLDSMFKETDPQWFFDSTQALKAGFRALETLGKPVVAAINGTALGGGYELALSCHHRIALQNPKLQVGLPEVTLGLLPGGGGVTRLVRMLGLQEAFPYLTEGKRVKVDKALKVGLVDDVAANADELMTKAKAWIEANPNAKQPWDNKKFRIPGGDPRRPSVAQMVAIAPAMLKKKTFGNYPAPQAILNAAIEGALVDFDTASRIETRYFVSVATSQVAKNMINTFWFQLNKVNAGGSRPDGVEPQPTEKVGVLGAGMMGHGIAYVTAFAGMDVVLKDVSLERAEEGKAKVAKLLKKRVSRGRMTSEKMEEILGRIKPSGDASDLEGCDLVVEAVFEDRNLKAKVTQEAEGAMLSTGVFASNTSTLPITGLAEASERPEKFVGLHFFSPVEKMKLVEIIVGEQTSKETLAKAFDYVLKIKKVPIVVNDNRGFYTSRVFGTYVNEGLALLAEGQHPRAIESAGLKAGMPVGPLAVSDEVNLGLIHHIREQTRKDMEAEGQTLPEHPANAVVDKMLEAGRKGKAQGAGFYEYPENDKKFLWPELQSMFGYDADKAIPQQEMIDRILFIQSLETIRCRDEGVFDSVEDANIGSIFGWGFAPFTGGTLQFINAYGLKNFVNRCNELAEKYGDRFQAPASLVERAEKGETF